MQHRYPLRAHRQKQNVFRCAYARKRQINPASLQPLRPAIKNLVFLRNGNAHPAKGGKVQIYRAFANRTATGIRNPARTASAEHCPQKEDGRTHFSHGFAAKRDRLHLAAVYHRRPPRQRNRAAKLPQNFQRLRYISNLRQIFQNHLIRRKHARRQNGQSGIFAPPHRKFSLYPLPAPHQICPHGVPSKNSFTLMLSAESLFGACFIFTKKRKTAKIKRKRYFWTKRSASDGIKKKYP